MRLVTSLREHIQAISSKGTKSLKKQPPRSSDAAREFWTTLSALRPCIAETEISGKLSNNVKHKGGVLMREVARQNMSCALAKKQAQRLREWLAGGGIEAKLAAKEAEKAALLAKQAEKAKQQQQEVQQKKQKQDQKGQKRKQSTAEASGAAGDSTEPIDRDLLRQQRKNRKRQKRKEKKLQNANVKVKAQLKM